MTALLLIGMLAYVGDIFLHWGFVCDVYEHYLL